MFGMQLSGVRARRFAGILGWCFSEAWHQSPRQVTVLIVAGILARLSNMAGFIVALLSINLVVSRQHRLDLLARHDLASLPEKVVILALIATVAGTFLLSIVLGLWKRQALNQLTDQVIKDHQTALFARFRAEVSQRITQPKDFPPTYLQYSQRIERQLLLAIKAATSHVIDGTMNFVSLSVTLLLLLRLDPLAFLLVLVIFGLTSLATVLAGHRQHRARLTVQQKATETVRQRVQKMRSGTADIEDPAFWSRIENEQQNQLMTLLEGAGLTSRFYSSTKGWSIGRIISTPLVSTPLMATLVFSGLILIFFARSQTSTIDLHQAILIVFVVRFALSFASATANDMRRVSERYSFVVLGNRILTGRLSILDQLNSGATNGANRTYDPLPDE